MTARKLITYIALLPLGVFSVMKEKLPVFWEEKVLPFIGALILAFEWAVTHFMAMLWILSPFFWVLGASGTVRLVERIENYRKGRPNYGKLSEEIAWSDNVESIISTTLVYLTVIALLLTILVFPNDSTLRYSGYLKAGNIREDKTSPSNAPYFYSHEENTKIPEIRMAEVSESWYYQYDFSEFKNDNLPLEDLTFKEFCYLILLVQNEVGRDGTIYNKCADFGKLQRAIAKSALNQIDNTEESSILNALEHEDQFGNLKQKLDIIYEVLISGGSPEDIIRYVDSFNGSLEAEDQIEVVDANIYSLGDKITKNNVLTVLNGLDRDIPKDALYWRNENYSKLSDAQDAFLSNYVRKSDLEFYLCQNVIGEEGNYWLLFSRNKNLNR